MAPSSVSARITIVTHAPAPAGVPRPGPQSCRRRTRTRRDRPSSAPPRPPRRRTLRRRPGRRPPRRRADGTTRPAATMTAHGVSSSPFDSVEHARSAPSVRNPVTERATMYSRAELLRLAVRPFHAGSRAAHAPREPEVVADLRARTGLATPCLLLDDNGAKSVGAGIRRRRETRRATTDDDDVVARPGRMGRCADRGRELVVGGIHGSATVVENDDGKTVTGESVGGEHLSTTVGIGRVAAPSPRCCVRATNVTASPETAPGASTMSAFSKRGW